MYRFGKRYPFFESLDENIVLVGDSVVSPYYNAIESGYFFEELDWLRRLFLFVCDLNVLILVHCSVRGASLDGQREVSIGGLCDEACVMAVSIESVMVCVYSSRRTYRDSLVAVL